VSDVTNPGRQPGHVPPGPPIAANSPAGRLAATPERFDLDQAAHVAAALAGHDDPLALAFRNPPRLSLPLGDVLAADAAAGSLEVAGFGLLGHGGALPRHYTAMAAAEARSLPAALRRRGPALQAFMDLLARRFTGLWIKAGAKYRPARSPQVARNALAAAAGLGTPGLAATLATPLPGLLRHAGHLSSRTRSADRLAALLEAEAGCRVHIIEFTGGWQRLPPGERSRLGQAHARLGGGAVAGSQIWDPAGSFTIRLGPLDISGFAALQPGQPLFRRLCELTRLHAGLEQEFVLNPVLAGAAVGPLRLGQEGRLGRNAWLCAARPRQRDAAEARLRGTWRAEPGMAGEHRRRMSG
jgi:type VI secretion system protein ImpH